MSFPCDYHICDVSKCSDKECVKDKRHETAHLKNIKAKRIQRKKA